MHIDLHGKLPTQLRSRYRSVQHNNPPSKRSFRKEAARSCPFCFCLDCCMYCVCVLLSLLSNFRLEDLFASLGRMLSPGSTSLEAQLSHNSAGWQPPYSIQ